MISPRHLTLWLLAAVPAIHALPQGGGDGGAGAGGGMESAGETGTDLMPGQNAQSKNVLLCQDGSRDFNITTIFPSPLGPKNCSMAYPTFPNMHFNYTKDEMKKRKMDTKNAANPDPITGLPTDEVCALKVIGCVVNWDANAADTNEYTIPGNTVWGLSYNFTNKITSIKAWNQTEPGKFKTFDDDKLKVSNPAYFGGFIIHVPYDTNTHFEIHFEDGANNVTGQVGLLELPGTFTDGLYPTAPAPASRFRRMNFDMNYYW